MKHISSIYMNGKAVGEAAVEKEGLYYRIECACDLTKDTIYRIVAVTVAGEISLGICEPRDEKLYLETKISARRLGDGIPKFLAVPKNENIYEFYEVVPERPFEDISIIRNCRLESIDGRVHLVKSRHL